MKTPITLIAAGALLALTACAPTTPAFDQDFGSSVRKLQAQQVRNPNATVANQGKLPDGIDGRAARETVERYERTFENPPRQPSTFILGVGSNAGSDVVR